MYVLHTSLLSRYFLIRNAIRHYYLCYFIVLTSEPRVPRRNLSLPRLFCSVDVVLVVTFPLFCSDRVLTCRLAWWQRLKRTPHLISEAVCPATNLSTNIERNATVSYSVRWINTDQPNGSHSAFTETMVPYQDGDRSFL